MNTKQGYSFKAGYVWRSNLITSSLKHLNRCLNLLWIHHTHTAVTTGPLNKTTKAWPDCPWVVRNSFFSLVENSGTYCISHRRANLSQLWWGEDASQSSVAGTQTPLLPPHICSFYSLQVQEWNQVRLRLEIKWKMEKLLLQLKAQQ